MNKYTKECAVCNKSFQCRRNKRKYCSPECYHQSMVKTYSKECEHCGKVFITNNIRDHKRRKYCSYDCSHAAQATSIELICETCGVVYLEQPHRKGRARFCSLECKRIGMKKQVTCVCEWCGKSFTEHAKRAKERRFCSQSCFYSAASMERLGEDNPNWKEQNCSSYRGQNWRRQRNKAFNRDSGVCQICGYHQKMRKPFRYIDVHHIVPYKVFDGDYKAANKLSNLITLCRSCHSDVEKGRIACPRRLI